MTRQWCILTADVSDADATVEMLVKLWIVIHGFSFASAWLELHKQRKKKSLQRSKALRKDNYYDTVLHTKRSCIHASELRHDN